VYFSSALFIVGLVVVGYTFSSRLVWLRYRLRLTQGYHTFAFTAAFGIVPLILSLLIMELPFFDLVTTHLVDFFSSVFPEETASGVPFVAALLCYGILISISIPTLLHVIVKELAGISDRDLKIYGMYTAEPSPLMANIVFSSLEKGLPIAFTMSDRKVYVGYPAFVSSSVFSPHGGDLHIIPFDSGYRDEKNLSMHLVTNYREVLREILSSGSDEKADEDFVVSIPVREVVHAHLYDHSVAPAFDRVGSS